MMFKVHRDIFLVHMSTMLFDGHYSFPTISVVMRVNDFMENEVVSIDVVSIDVVNINMDVWPKHSSD